MGGLFIIAWMTGEGVIVYRSVKEQHMPPSPRQLLVASGLYVGLAIIAEYQPARAVATAFAWAVNVAVLMRVLPGGTDAVTSGTASGWSSIGLAGNTVIFPNGTAASAVDASTSTSTTTSTSGAGAGGSASANQAVAKTVISDNPKFSGWGTGSQWTCLANLWDRESGWSTSATNPSSGAYGIAQSLHGTKGGQGGNEYSSSDSEGLTAAQLAAANAGNAADQILWGLEYIAVTYGSPCAAWDHETAEGWY